MYLRRLILFGFVASAMMLACSTPTSDSVFDDAEEILSSSSKAKSSSSHISEDGGSTADEGGDCIGEAGKPWDGTTAKDFACGSGTKLSPYVILTAEQLAHLSFVVGAKDKDYLEKYYRLGADIVLNEGMVIDENGGLVADSAKLHKWTPIGNADVAFGGSFDGDGHSVSGLFINTTSTHNGLFGNSSGTIQNLTVENGWVYGGDYTAGIVGASSGKIISVANKNSVQSEKNFIAGVAGLVKGSYSNKAIVSQVQNLGMVKGKDDVGGVAGSAYSAECDSLANYGIVEGQVEVGGIFGRGGYTYISSYALLTKNASNYGAIDGINSVGGIVGAAGYSSYTMSVGSIVSVFEKVRNAGYISGKKYVGGVVGTSNLVEISMASNVAEVVGDEFVSGVIGNAVSVRSEFVYNIGSVFGSEYVGGVIGYNKEGITSSAYSTGKVDGDSLVGLMIGYNYNTTMADYYYLKQGEQEPFGLNNGGGVATSKTENEMKSKEFAELLGEDFAYDPEANNGYPILKWESEE